MENVKKLVEVWNRACCSTAGSLLAQIIFRYGGRGCDVLNEILQRSYVSFSRDDHFLRNDYGLQSYTRKYIGLCKEYFFA